MLGYHCPDCAALFDEMHSAIMEAKSIAQDARAQSRAGNRPGKRTNEWQISERWEDAHQRWLAASREFKTHFATHRSTPSSAKGMGQV